MAEGNHRDCFYAGNTSHDPSVYIGLDLDAKRPTTSKLIAEINKKKMTEWFHISVYGDRKQGKTIFMARVAYNLSHQKNLKMFGRKYHVLWCKKDKNTPFRRNLQGSNPLNVDLLAEYYKFFSPRKYMLFSKKPMVVFVDDIFRPEIQEPSNIIEQSAIQVYLRSLMRERISIITTSSSQEIAIEETDDLLKLKLTKVDAECILDKLVQQKIILREFADNFLNNSSKKYLYKKQLFAFLSSVLAESGHEAIFKSAFIKDFEQHFTTLSEKEKIALQMIALCQILDISLLEPVLQVSFPESFQRLQSGLCGLVRREQNNGDTYIYHMGGPFLAKWLLTEKYAINNFDNLSTAYLKLVSLFLHSPSLSEVQKAHYVRLILERLASGWHNQIFDIHGKSFAAHLLESSKQTLELCINGLDVADSLVAWAATMVSLGKKEIASRLYIKAVNLVKIPEELTTAENMRTPVSLAMGLADMPNKKDRELAIPLFQKILSKFIAEKAEPSMIRRVTHKLSETLADIGQYEQALDTIEKSLIDVLIDAPLWQKKGDILEFLGRLSEAKECFKQSIESARPSADKNPQTLLNCLQHYADFLSRHHNLSYEPNESPEVYLKEAKELFANKKVIGYEVLMNAWAKLKRNEGNIPEAKRLYEECIAYCRQTGIIHPHSWNDYARLLMTHGLTFKEKSYEDWLGEAEKYITEIINDDEFEARSKRITYHILGLLISSKTYCSLEGKQRPAFSEAIDILQGAFESPEPERSDDDKKTFQDVITHVALKDVYLRWSDSGVHPDESSENLIHKADFHFQKAFSGLPRQNLNSAQVAKHMLEAQIAYAGFKWMRLGDTVSAQKNYEETIDKFESLNYCWPEAYNLYVFYANFLFQTQKNQAMDSIIGALQRALQVLPSYDVQKRSELTQRLGHNLHTRVLDEIDSLQRDNILQKMDEVIEAFSYVLTTMPEDKGAAKELSHIFFAPKKGILLYLCTKDRVEKVKNILWTAWRKCPFNLEALSGLIEVADSLIDRVLNDDNTLNDLKNLINSKITEDENAADSLVLLCNRRKHNQYRGKLTKMLCDA